MELYNRFPKICTLWAFMEVVLFGGVIFGWGSLVFILKEEGFYLDLCEDVQVESNHTLVTNVVLTNKTLVADGYSINNSAGSSKVTDAVTTPTSNHGNHIRVSCQAQEARLNLWFSIAVSFMYLVFTGIGYLIRRYGIRITRCIFIVGYLVGTLCLAFATPDIPWLLLPGLCCMGTSGLVILATNLQVASLHPHLRSTIVAIFTGLFDFSTIMKQLIKVAYEHNVMRRTSYIIIAVAFGVIVSFSTFVLLPHGNLTDEHVEEIKRRRSSVKESNMKKLLNKTEEKSVQDSGKKQALLETENGIMHSLETGIQQKEADSRPKMTLCQAITSLTNILHLYWLFVHALRFVSFIGLLNVWLENIVKDEEKVGELLSTFSYITMGALLTALLCGFVYDWQRKKYEDGGFIRRTYSPVVFPMVLVIVYSSLTTVACYIQHEWAPYIAFIVFTFLRSALFTVAVTFIGEAFSLDYFGVLFGFIQLAAGIAGLIQYPIFSWYDSYIGSFKHVNIFLLCLQVSTLVHPIRLFILGRRDNTKPEPQTLEIMISPGVVTPASA